jgi:hypothetical protein
VCICSSCACCCVRVGLRWLGAWSCFAPLRCPSAQSGNIAAHAKTTTTTPRTASHPDMRIRLEHECRLFPFNRRAHAKSRQVSNAIPAPASGLVGEGEVSSFTSSEPRFPNTAINTAACERKKTHAARALPLDASPPPLFRSRGHWRSDVCRVV